ncbi:hypothetical protein F5Y19DRAFT_487265 [Xylariaceae sp. FL1651]|nr:hypothetical protein F5Y19DRAFT_487265 [Xylariaceae sp. FL1651]
MEFTNPFANSQQDNFLSGTGTETADVTAEVGTRLRRKSSLRTNFSYPRLSRHESSESRSSNGSVPGMTDTSDSDLSFDDDCVYNASAGQLWDSFWPDNMVSSTHKQYPAVLQSSRSRDYFNANPTKRRSSNTEDDTIKIMPSEHNTKGELPAHGHQTLQCLPPQPAPKKAAVTYSVYPRPSVTNVQRYPHPPRISSLSFDPPSPRRTQLLLRGSKSSVGLNPGKSIHNLNTHFIAPSLVLNCNAASSPRQQSLTTINKATSVPVSPAYPPPPTPRTLRPSTSAFNLRDKTRAHGNERGLVAHNVTAPLTPLLPEPLPSRPQVERFVSVFELDSDSDTESDAADESSNSFAKRIARGLHKKSASEKRGAGERKAVAVGLTALDANAAEKDFGQKPRDLGSLNRKRGGSLGRIFGLMGR